MKSFDVWDLARQEGRQEGRQEVINEMTLALIRKGWEKNLTPEFIAELGNIPLKKVKDIISTLELENKNGSIKNN